MIVAIIVIVIIGFLAFIGFCMIASAAPDEEERRREDEDQIKYLRKMREENERKQILESDEIRRKTRR